MARLDIDRDRHNAAPNIYQRALAVYYIGALVCALHATLHSRTEIVPLIIVVTLLRSIFELRVV